MKTLIIRMSDTLVNMFHHRIKYPWQDKQDSPEKGEKAGAKTQDKPDEPGRAEPPAKEKPN